MTGKGSKTDVVLSKTRGSISKGVTHLLKLYPLTRGNDDGASAIKLSLYPAEVHWQTSSPDFDFASMRSNPQGLNNISRIYGVIGFIAGTRILLIPRAPFIAKSVET